MKIKIRSYIGVKYAELDITSGITLIAGDNAVGKSSILRAIGALVTGEPKPKGLGTPEALIMDGCKEAELVLTNGETTAAITYPNPRFTAQGDPPHASAIAAGLANYTDLNERERAVFLTNLLRATPTPAQVRKAFKGQMSDDDVVSVLKLLEVHGWDETCERLKERRIKLKAKWEDLTGERYGDSKSKDWRPEGWDERTDKPEAHLRVAVAQEAFDRANQEAVMGEAEYQRLHDLLGKREPTQMALDMARRQMPTIEAEWAKLRSQLDAMPQPVEEGLACPHCGAFVVVRINPVELLPLEPVPEGESERRRRALAEQSALVAEAYSKLEYQQGHIAVCKAKLKEIDKAEEALKGARTGNGETQEDKVAKAREALERAQASAARARQAKDAADLGQRVHSHNLIIDTLGPEGLRRQEMETKLAAFEQELASLTENLLTWQRITIDRENLLPVWGTRPYVLCSKSEQWRVNVTLQIAIALLEGADIVIVDGADILAQKSQEDLLAGLLNKLPMPVVVGATYDRPRDAPDLALAGLGRVYWIADGVVQAEKAAVT